MEEKKENIILTAGHFIYALLILCVLFCAIFIFPSCTHAETLTYTNTIGLIKSGTNLAFGTSQFNAIAQRLDMGTNNITFDRVCFYLKRIGLAPDYNAVVKIFYNYLPNNINDNTYLVWQSTSQNFNPSDLEADLTNAFSNPSYVCVNGVKSNLAATLYYVVLTGSNPLKIDETDNYVYESGTHAKNLNDDYTDYSSFDQTYLDNIWRNDGSINYRIKLDFYDNTLTINTPLQNDYYLNGSSITYSGDCPIDGTNELELTSNSFPSGNYNIDCVNHSWSTTIPAECPYTNFIDKYIFDKNFIRGYPIPGDYAATVHLNCESTYNGAFTWYADFIYPEAVESKVFDLNASSDFPFRITYRIPSTVNKSDTAISLGKSDNCDGVINDLVSGNIGTLDPDDLGYIDLTNNVSVGDNQCWYLKLNFNSTTKYMLHFTVNGKSSGGQEANLPGAGSWGKAEFLKKYILPRSGFLESRINSAKDEMEGKVPFSLYYAIKDYLYMDTNTSTDTKLNMNLNLDNTPVSLTILDTSESHISGIIPYARGIIEFGLYLTVAAYLAERIFVFFRNEI